MIGKTLSHYKIVGKLSEGGMRVVYKATDTSLERTVALKFLAPDLVENQEGRQRFIHGARAAAILDPGTATHFRALEECGTSQIIAGTKTGGSPPIRDFFSKLLGVNTLLKTIFFNS